MVESEDEKNPLVTTEDLQMEKKAFGLYDRVKLDMYLILLQAMGYLYDIMDRDIPEGKKRISEMTKGSRFVASILSLYILCKPKLKYVPDPKYKKLEELDDYYFGRKDLAKMTFLEAREYLDLLRDFEEALGITQFEVEKLTGSQTVLKEMVED